MSSLGSALPLTLALIVTLAAARAHASCEDGRPVTCGHRGTGTQGADNPWPENTIPSLLAAAEEGATMVEFDVQLTSDGVPVLMHDATLDKTTDGAGCLSAWTLDELKQLDAAVATPMAGQGVQIPTLAEVLEAVPIDLNVELKYGGEGCPVVSREEFAAAVLEVLETDDAPRLQTVSSFDLMLLEQVRAQDPDLYLGQLALTADLAQLAVTAGFQAYNLEVNAVNADTVDDLRALGLAINVWTVNAPLVIGDLFELDVDAIITDEPPEVEAVREMFCGATETDSETGTATATATATATDSSTGDDSSGGSSDSADSHDSHDSYDSYNSYDASESVGDTNLESDSAGPGDEDGQGDGCGCRANGRGEAGWSAALALLLLRPRRRRGS